MYDLIINTTNHIHTHQLTQIFYW